MIFQAALVQMSAGSDKDANLRAAVSSVTRAAREGARLVVLPEVFSFVGDASHWLAQAEPLDGPTLSTLSTLAADLKLHLLAGSVLEQAGRPRRIRNTSVFFGPDGKRIAVYRKMHLFDVTLPDGVVFSEVDHTEPGSEVVTARTELGAFGLSICYDLRFPELYRAMMIEGVDFLLVPSAFTAFTGRDHWEVLLRARAIENQAFVLAANQCGRAVTGVEFYGHSMIVDPWGDVLACGGGEPELVQAEIDTERLGAVRSRVAALRHVRTDLFSHRGKSRGES